ncbi:hypothetical protein R84981_002903 [Carnimonas sp. R-84981]|uniref:Gp138 family membrane-puncturing spike protein n=1 Tax=Carnimonas bestiolae TaxID=3402172 RepID=UPI003EDBD59D
MSIHDSDINPLGTLLARASHQSKREILTSLPGEALAFNPELQTCQVRIGVKRRLNGEYVEPPIISEVPVYFAGTADWVAYHEIPDNTPGWIIFAHRNTDTWMDQGGASIPADDRMFAMSDALFIPGVRHQAAAIPDFPTSGMGMMSRDGTTRIDATGEALTLTKGNANVEMSDDAITLLLGGASIEISSSGISITGGTLTHNGVDVGATHTHPGVQSGDSTTGTPQ